MKGVLLQSILLSSLALVWASPTPSDPAELDIPLDSILSGNLSTYSGHPLFAKYEAWVARTPDMPFLNGTDASVKTDNPTLDGVVCTEELPDCLLSSSITVPDTSPMVARSPLTKRGVALGRLADTHWKTYFKGQHGGHEHYTTWNLKCRKLEYRSTGFVLDKDEYQKFNDNDISTKVYVHEYRKLSHKVTLQQNYKCGWFSNPCCASYYTATSTASGKMTSWTWECGLGRDAPACQG
ncbi:MAG: hypothetical protein M1839_002329 [Geoglossum umbratile]|nr:MAG: hypothetical protein M1839_002329 [Geoglossum umbratile]